MRTIGAVVLSLTLVTCAATTPVPATTARATGDTFGKFVWHDLVTDDIDAARRFYGQLLGWQFMTVTRIGKPYVIATYQGQPVAGFVPVKPVTGDEVSQWIGYQSVSNVEDRVAAVERAGGKTLVAPVTVAVGRAAVVSDPGGAPLGLLRLTAGDPPDEAAPRDHTFFWMEYVARDPAATAAFYADTFGYQRRVTDQLGTAEYVVLSRGKPRGGVLPAPRADLREAWLPYLLVSDPAPLVKRAESLGGTVFLAPRPEIRRGSLAVVIDPSGAMVALQKYPF
jgi:predicted enzyme related to lactoylglutathione lyase